MVATQSPTGTHDTHSSEDSGIGGIIGDGTFDRACVPCRRMKRKCDKLLPTCSLCKRLSRECSYDVGHDSNSGDMMPLGRSAELTHYTEPNIRSTINRQAAELIGGELGAMNCATQYFQDIHPSFPILDQQRYLDRLSEWWSEPRADHNSLLAICMLMLISKPTECNMQRDLMPLYLLAKTAASQLEVIEQPTVELLQCRLLINLFEVWHGMITAAQASIVTCILTADALGIRDKSVCELKHTESLVNQAINVIHRFLSIDISPSSVLATTLTQQKLPTQCLAQCPTAIGQHNLASLAEASRLLGQALQHIYKPTTVEQFNATEAIQILKTLISFKGLLTDAESNGIGSFMPAKGLVNSAMFCVFEKGMHLKSDSHQFCAIYSKAFFQGFIEEIALTAKGLGAEIASGNFLGASPFVLHSIYKAAGLVLLSEQSVLGESIQSQILEASGQLLKAASNRWLLAEVYWRKLVELQYNVKQRGL